MVEMTVWLNEENPVRIWHHLRELLGRGLNSRLASQIKKKLINIQSQLTFPTYDPPTTIIFFRVLAILRE